MWLERDEPDLITGRVHMKYPVKKDLSVLRDNRAQAIGFQTGVNKRLDREGLRELYDKEIQGYVLRGVFKPLSPEEIASWKGPVNYVSHHGVKKPHSVSTALRVVSNSSLRNNQAGGVALNDLLMKGPNVIRPIIQAQLDWRGLREVVVWDYAKAYNTVWTGPEEMHVRRLVHKMSDEGDWTTYGINKMHIGDRPAATGLEVAKDLVANTGLDLDPPTVHQLKRGYVDDGNGGGTLDMVKKLVGNEEYSESDDSWSYDGTVATIMKRGGFRIKYMIHNGEARPHLLDKFGGSILGLNWDPSSDHIIMSMSVNLHPRKQKLRTGPDLTEETVHELDTAKLTRRIVLSQVHGIYDPLGLLSPLTIKFKILIQKINDLGMGWDEEITDSLRDEVVAVLRNMVLAGPVVFNRSFLGAGWESGWDILAFWDGGKPASATCLYARTPLIAPGPEGQTHELHLIAAKARVTPSSTKHGNLRTSTPRTEMRGLVMLGRLLTHVLGSVQHLPKEIMVVGDSQSTISAVEADHRVLDIN